MSNFSSIHTEETLDKQQIVRTSVTDLVHKSMGDGGLDSWIRSAIQEKIDRDIGRVYPSSHLEGSAQARRISQSVRGEHAGVLYIAPQKMLIIVEINSKFAIKVLKASPGSNESSGSAHQIYAECKNSGLPVEKTAVVRIPFDSNSKSDIWASVYGAEEEGRARSFALGLALAVITQSSDRDIQRMPGPSDLANPCDLCVARRIAGAAGIDFQQAPRNFSLKAWVGTAAHQKLERDLPEHNEKARQELTVSIGKIDGLGEIKGHVDLHLPDVATMSDFKTTDLSKLEKIRSRGVPSSHRGQTMLYMHGLRRSGRACDYATLVYIPRDSTEKSDIWTASCSYRGDIAVGLLNRTEDIFRRLQSGVVSFDSDPECFVCHYQRYTKN